MEYQTVYAARNSDVRIKLNKFPAKIKESRAGAVTRVCRACKKIARWDSDARICIAGGVA